MGSVNLQEEANFTRLSRLLVDKGTKALRITLDAIHPTANLLAVLKRNRASLLKLKPRVINDSQWDLLFPPSGNPPDSKTFDVTLLTVLLRNICWSTHPPVTGWNTMPPDTDRSPQANVTRIKLFRNQVYAHVTSTQVDEETFESLWQKISQALLDLNILRTEVDDLKTCPLGHEEEVYIKMLKEWYLREEDCKSMLEHLTQLTRENHLRMQQLYQSSSRQSENGLSELSNREKLVLRQLAKHNFKSKIARKVKLFHHGTRDWLLKKVDKWFTTEDESRLLLLTAGPGFGKSVFAAKICELFKERGKLAACHFCDFSDSNLKDPMMMLQSLASQMCENVVEFREKLLDQLGRPHKVKSLRDAFQVYLQNPLDELEVEPRLIVIDGLDESTTNDRSDLVKLIDNHFADLPYCVKVLVTSRPEISVQSLRQFEIATDDVKIKNNQLDLQQYLEDCLPNLVANKDRSYVLPAIVLRCEGSFLYAFHVQCELNKHKDLDHATFKEILFFLPQGMDSIYKEYFQRLEIELQAVVKKSSDLFKLLELLGAARAGLPLKFIARALDLDTDCREAIQIIHKVNEAISCLLYVSDDIVTVFHKSVHDWLVTSGYKKHEYTVKLNDGATQLWLLCEELFEETKKKYVEGDHLLFTPELNHALLCGYEYLLACDMRDGFSWLVDVIIVHLRLTYFDISKTFRLRNLWGEVLRNDKSIGLALRQRISWHFIEISHYLSFPTLYNQSSLEFELPQFCYWESILRHSPEGFFSDTEKDIARAAYFLHCVKRQSLGINDMTPVLAKPFSLPIAAVGISSNKKLAAVALTNETIFILSLPDLVTIFEYATAQSITCCTFAPDDSFVLFGILETVLDIERKEEVSFFKGNSECFKSCSFSPTGKSLVTCDGSNTLKLWDIVTKKLLSVLSAETRITTCSFSKNGLFIVGNKLNAERQSVQRDSYCVWNSITFQRVDERRLVVGQRMKKKPALMTERCDRCLGSLDPRPVKYLRQSICQAFLGIHNSTDCILLLSDIEQSLCVYESTHFTRTAAWPIKIFRFPFNSDMSHVNVTLIGENSMLYKNEVGLIVYNAVPTKDDQPRLSRPTCVLWCSFSPDGTRLATCTSDGFTNLWNVDACQVYQRFRSSRETLTAACYWSRKFLFVFNLIDNSPSLLKIPVDENSEIMVSKGQSVSLCSIVGEFLPISSILDYSEGYLSLECGDSMPVKVIDVHIIEHPKIITLPGIKPRMNIAVSSAACFVLGTGSENILWKRNEVDPTAYEILVHVRFPYDHNPSYACCFSSSSKFAVMPVLDPLPQSFVVIDVSTCKGTTKTPQKVMNWQWTIKILKIFCTDAVVIVVAQNLISILDLKSLKVLGCSYSRYLTPCTVTLSKLSPNGTVLAVPMVNGAMEFFGVKQYPQSLDVSRNWSEVKSLFEKYKT